jgi:hypothetical protein
MHEQQGAAPGNHILHQASQAAGSGVCNTCVLLALQAAASTTPVLPTHLPKHSHHLAIRAQRPCLPWNSVKTVFKQQVFLLQSALTQLVHLLAPSP